MRNIFLDRDGIINEVVIRDSVVSSPRSLDEFVIRSDFLEFYHRLKRPNQGTPSLFIFSNQPDVSRGFLSESVLSKMNERMQEHFDLKEIVYCTHDNHHNCRCRKPKPGMLVYLLEKYGLSGEDSLVIGDGCKDIEAASAAGIKSVRLSTAYNDPSKSRPDYTVKRLTDIFLLDLGL